MSGADWLLKPVTDKAKPPKFERGDGIEVRSEDIDALLDDVERKGKKLRAGIGSMADRLDAIAQLGLTPDLLVLLVTEKAPYPRGSKHKLSPAQVEACLKGLFALRDFVR